MKLTKSQFKNLILEELSDEELAQVFKMINPFFDAIDNNREITGDNFKFLRKKINDVEETNLLRLQHYERTGEVISEPFREPEGTGELGRLPADAGELDSGTRSMRAGKLEPELDPEYMEEIKLTKAQLSQIIKEEAAQVLKEHAKNYVWGIKGPSRVANQYSLKPFNNPKVQNKNKVITENVGENEATYPFRIFCDMDGVLVDLLGGLEKELKKKRFMIQAKNKQERTKQEKALMNILGSVKSWTELKKDPSTTEGQRQVLTAIEEVLNENEEFWGSILDPTNDAHDLWGFISKYDPYILSHPWDQESADGKEMWCRTHLEPVPSRVLLPMGGNKEQYAQNKETGAANILIDDMDGYLQKWEEAGGIAIKHETGNAKATIAKLVKEFKKYKKEEPE